MTAAYPCRKVKPKTRRHLNYCQNRRLSRRPQLRRQELPLQRKSPRGDKFPWRAPPLTQSVSSGAEAIDLLTPGTGYLLAPNTRHLPIQSLRVGEGYTRDHELICNTDLYTGGAIPIGPGAMLSSTNTRIGV